MRGRHARPESPIQNPKSKIQNHTSRPAAPLAFAVVALALAAGCSRVPPEPWKADNHFIQSHRCGRLYGPTETAPTMAASLRAGADALDVDVRRTRDGVLVCFHDDVVLTRECFGPVELLDWADLAGADVGREFDPSFTPARAVTFDEFVRWCAANEVRFHFELRDDNLASPSVAIVDQYRAMPLCSGMDGFRAPKREDYRPVNLGMHTMGTGGDDDLRYLRRAAFRHEGAKLKINIDDCTMLADLLDRHGERRAIGAFRFDAPPRRPRTLPTSSGLVSTFPDNDAAAIRVINAIAAGRLQCLPDDLMRGAKGGSPTLRAGCIWALGRLKHAPARGLIAEAATRTPSPREGIVAMAATWALSEYDRPEDVAALREALMRGVAAGDAKSSGMAGWHAEFAARALGRMSAPAAVEGLGEALKARPANEYLTQEIAAALARQGARAVPRLVACLDDDRRVHRREIVWALVRLQADSARAVSESLASTKDPAVRRNCLRVIGLCERPSIDADALLGCLGSDDPDTRLLAAWVAGKHRIRAARDRLTQLLADEDEAVRAQAAQALTRL